MIVAIIFAILFSDEICLAERLIGLSRARLLPIFRSK